MTNSEKSEKVEKREISIFSVWKNINKLLTARELQQEIIEQENAYFSERGIRKKIISFCEIAEICEISKKPVTYTRQLNGKTIEGKTYAMAFRFKSEKLDS